MRYHVMRKFEMSEAVKVGKKDRVGRIFQRGRNFQKRGSTQWSWFYTLVFYFILSCALFFYHAIYTWRFLWKRLYTTAWWLMVEYQWSTFHNDCFLKFAGRQKSSSNWRKGVWCKRKWSCPRASGVGGGGCRRIFWVEISFVSESKLSPSLRRNYNRK